jgi:hypothetical protein
MHIVELNHACCAVACSGNLVVEGGSERVLFRLLVDMERLEATLNYESCESPPLALAAIEDVRFNLGVHPAALALSASLGNLRAQDCGLPEVRAPTRLVCLLWVHARLFLGHPHLCRVLSATFNAGKTAHS